MHFRLLRIKFILLLRSIFQPGLEAKAKLAVGIIVLSIFAGGGYYLFYRIFGYLKEVQDIGAILSDRLIGVGFLAFGLMLLVSNLISALSTLYRSDETHFLLTTPLSYRDVFWTKFWDNLFYSSWATATIGIPLFLAYSIVFGLHWHYFLVSALALLPAFLLIPAYLGVLFSIMFFIIAKRIGKRWTLAGFIVAAVALMIIYTRLNSLKGIFMSVQGDLHILNYYLRNLATNKALLTPWGLISGALQFARLGDWKSFALRSSALVSGAMAGAIILDWFAQHFYYSAFLGAQESRSKSRQKSGAKQTYYEQGFLYRLLAPFPREMRSLLVKDARLFLRDPNQWTQFGVLVVLLGVYLINLRYVPLRIGNESLRLGIAFANYGFSGYILATLSVRFVYPSVSMEGQSFYLVRSAPISAGTIFWEKFWLAFVVFFVIAEAVAVISGAILSQSIYLTLLTAGGILLMSVSLVSISVGLGILFPDFEEPNPGRIASSGGGMIAALISLVYVGLSVMALALPTYAYIKYITFKAPFPTMQIVIGSIVLIVLNLVATVIPLRLGLAAIERIER